MKENKTLQNSILSGNLAQKLIKNTGLMALILGTSIEAQAWQVPSFSNMGISDRLHSTPELGQNLVKNHLQPAVTTVFNLTKDGFSGCNRMAREYLPMVRNLVSVHPYFSVLALAILPAMYIINNKYDSWMRKKIYNEIRNDVIPNSGYKLAILDYYNKDSIEENERSKMGYRTLEHKTLYSFIYNLIFSTIPKRYNEAQLRVNKDKEDLAKIDRDLLIKENNKCALLEKECRELEQECYELKQDYVDVDNTDKQLDGTKAQLKEKVKQLKEKKAQLQEKSDELEHKKRRFGIDRLLKQLNQDQTQLDKLRQQYDALHSQITDLKNRLKNIIWAAAHWIIGDLKITFVKLGEYSNTEEKDRVQIFCRYVNSRYYAGSQLTGKLLIEKYTECVASAVLKILQSINTRLPKGYRMKDFIYDEPFEKSELICANTEPTMNNVKDREIFNIRPLIEEALSMKNIYNIRITPASPLKD